MCFSHGCKSLVYYLVYYLVLLSAFQIGGRYIWGLFVLENSGHYESIPLNAIAAMQFETGAAVYNPVITYLPKPHFVKGCDLNLIAAIHDYLPVPTEAIICLGSIAYSTGPVYKDEYGIIVQANTNG